jgi:hypothetical protein
VADASHGSCVGLGGIVEARLYRRKLVWGIRTHDGALFSGGSPVAVSLVTV